jgi:alanine dehydrogenase
MNIYNEHQCKQLITVPEAIEVIRNVFSIGEDTDHHMVPKTYLDINKDGKTYGDFRAMPARMGKISGIKWVSVFPENNSKPTVLGTILLNSSETGELLAILEGTYITNIRTAAAAAVASEKLAHRGSKVAAFIGCGGQTKLHVEAIKHAVPTIDTFYFYDLDLQVAADMAQSCAEPLGEPKKELYLVARSIEDCVKGADILTTLTPSREPIIKGEWLKQGVHINAMGADARGKREFDNKCYDRVGLWTYDDIVQASHSGETQHLIELAFQRHESSSKVSEADYIGEIASQQNRPPHSDTQITLFDSTGLALQDIAVASWIYKTDIEKRSSVCNDDPYRTKYWDYTEGSQHGHRVYTGDITNPMTDGIVK